jgi:hypothetical protein
MDSITYAGIPECLLLSNGEIEIVATTKVGPRILCYRYRGEHNIFAELPDAHQSNALGTWKPYGGHRLWAAPEVMPQTYYPDNDPVKVEPIDEHAVRLRAIPESENHIQKEIRITLAEHGSDVSIEHIITNVGNTNIELAPWALTIMRTGGTTIIPQEPYRSHDESLLPARPIVLWHFTDLTDPRWKFGKRLIQLSTDSTLEAPQKIGVLDKQGWAAYYQGQTLFVKEFECLPNAIYPDYGSNCETYTAGAFMELESLGMMQELGPRESATHVERWRLFRNVILPESEEGRSEALGRLLAAKR